MKKLFTITILIIFTSVALLGQKRFLNNPCLNINYGQVSYHNLAMSLSYQLKDSISIGLGGNILWKHATSTPKDFNNTAYKSYRSVDLLIDKKLPLSNTNNYRIILSIGLGYTQIKTPTNWKKKNNSSKGDWINSCLFCDPNYTFQYDIHSTASIITKFRMEFRLHPLFGISIEPNIRIVQNNIYPMLSIGFVAGK